MKDGYVTANVHYNIFTPRTRTDPNVDVVTASLAEGIFYENQSGRSSTSAARSIAAAAPCPEVLLDVKNPSNEVMDIFISFYAADTRCAVKHFILEPGQKGLLTIPTREKSMIRYHAVSGKTIYAMAGTKADFDHEYDLGDQVPRLGKRKLKLARLNVGDKDRIDFSLVPVATYSSTAEKVGVGILALLAGVGAAGVAYQKLKRDGS